MLEMIRHGIDVKGLQAQLQDESVWNGIRLRTGHTSPHRELDDIWVRYRDFADYTGDMRAFNSEHESVWYPIADKLTEAKRIAEEVAGAAQLGAVLITRIPAGKQCYPHIDQGWHARFYEKHAVQVQGNERQSFHVENKTLHPVTGDEFTFDNSRLHWVKNASDEPRITMIVCMRAH
jgi:aspartyl/asparaginyl beta-hydroxylase